MNDTLRRLGLCAVVIAAGYSAATYLVPRDDSDPATGGRSGFIVYTDALSGCQYLKVAFNSGLVPRIAADGHSHQGCRAVKN